MRDYQKDPIKNPAKAMRQYCIDVCMCGQTHEVRACDDVSCPLYTFRMGKNPHLNRPKMSKAQKAKLAKVGLEGTKKMKEMRNASSDSDN